MKLMNSRKGNLFLLAKLREISLMVLLVNGSTMCSIHSDLWERLMQEHRLELKGTSVSLKMANNSVVLIAGVRFDMEMEGEIEVTLEFLVAAIEYSMIIEIDLLKNIQGILDVGHHTLRLQDKLVQCASNIIMRKSNGRVRLCINYHDQNSLVRES